MGLLAMVPIARIPEALTADMVAVQVLSTQGGGMRGAATVLRQEMTALTGRCVRLT